MERKAHRAHLLCREHNHHDNVKAPALAYSIHELGCKATLMGIAAILPHPIWHCGLRWFALRPIKFHICMTGYWNVSIAYCCLKSLRMLVLFGLALPSIKIACQLFNGWSSKMRYGVQKQIYFRLTKMYSFSTNNIPTEIVTLPIPSSPLMTQWQLRSFYGSTCTNARFIASVNIRYRYITLKIHLIPNARWCRITISPDIPGY